MNKSLLELLQRGFFKIINGLIFFMNHVEHEHYGIKGYIKIYRERQLCDKLPNKSIFIGDCFGCNSGLKYNPIGGDICTILRTIDNGIIKIGSHVGISNASLVALNSIEIGNYVTIGGGVKIYDNDFHSLDYETRVFSPYDDIRSKPVKICDGAFIGAGSYILKGVTVGKKSIIGAASVVTKDVPSGEIWAGNPARFIRKIQEK